jgi:hypothetical protein
MSINWVTRRPDLIKTPFTLLPNEVIHHAQEERVTVRLTPIGQPNPESIVIKGHAYLTNQRAVVLSDKSITQQDKENDTFALLYKDVLDQKLTIPWFGSNKYEIKFRISDANGGLNYLYPWLMVVEFQYGGAPKFSEKLEGLLARHHDQQAEAEDLPRYSE